MAAEAEYESRSRILNIHVHVDAIDKSRVRKYEKQYQVGENGS